MCGLAGMLTAQRPCFELRSVTDRMQNRLSHRGPDDRGCFVSANGCFSLAHSRLSILDLSAAAHQPMASADGRYWIAFNGEIYNYRELREELGESEATDQG